MPPEPRCVPVRVVTYGLSCFSILSSFSFGPILALEEKNQDSCHISSFL